MQEFSNQLSNQLFAIGNLFQPDRPRFMLEKDTDLLWDFSEKNGIRYVFGFPIKYPSYEPSYPDEVRYYPANPLNASIPPSLWEAVVIHETNQSYFLDQLELLPDPLKVPVFTQSCELLIPVK